MNQAEAGTLLRDHVAALTRRYRGALREAYVDAPAVEERFHSDALSPSPTEAARRWHGNVRTYGTLRRGKQATAQEAAIFGAQAYRANIARSNR